MSSSFMDKAKDMLDQAKEKASELASQHGDSIERGIAKAGDFVDQKTHGKYADKVERARAMARDAADKLAAEGPTGEEPTGEGSDEPHSSTPRTDPSDPTPV